eukprot:TRINITY_DN4159_c0_g1_i2.p1 TRINITY_DN4159_c0_g1~~TRINITY_DN4159_c0_g1_i2.p1  ORF type:complete len:198 (+),score=50.48 TRINITY_DN4159_c0_g1_i2:24-596(+)
MKRPAVSLQSVHISSSEESSLRNSKSLRAKPMGFFQRRIINPLIDVVKQGLTPESLAWSLSIGMTAGIFPIPGVTAILAGILTFLLKLNFVAAQVSNLVSTPIELMLIIPFVRIGDWVLGPSVDSYDGLLDRARNNLFEFLSVFWGAVLHAVAAWAVTAPFVAFALYRAFLPFTRKFAARYSRNEDDEET